MHFLLGIFLFAIGSSLLMVGYVLIRDIMHKRTAAAVEVADEMFFEEVEPEETVVREYDYRQKTA